MSVYSYWTEWKADIGRTEDLTRALSAAAAEQIGGSLRTIDLLIQHVGQYVQANAGLDQHLMAASLDLQSHSFPEVAALIITDENGLAHSEKAGQVWDFSKRDFFVVQRQAFPKNEIVIEGPVHDEATGDWRVMVSRPLIANDARFHGVVAAALKPNFFADVLKPIRREGQGMVMLMNVNRVVFGRFPDNGTWVSRVAADFLPQEVKREEVQGTLRTYGRIDGIDEIAAYRSVHKYPLVTVSGIPVEELENAWRKAITPSISILATICGVMVYLARLFGRHEKEKLQAAFELAELNQDLEMRVADRTKSLSYEIVERSRAEAEAQKLKEAYRELFDGAIEGILIHRDFKPLLANHSCAQLFGYGSVDELLNLPSALSLVSPEARPNLAALTREVLSGDSAPTILEFEGVRSDGEKLWCLNSIRCVSWEGMPAIQAGFVNVTATRNWQAAMRKAKEAAEQASGLKSRFLAIASHDLRQPAQALAFYADALARRVAEGEPAEIVHRMSESTEALNSLLDSLLDISRLDAGKVKPEMQAIQLGTILERVWILCAPAAEQNGISLSVVVPNLQIVSDPTLLEQILQNLIANAIRYTPAGGKVLVGCRRCGGFALIQVIDTGRGIPEEALPHIFEEFFRLGSTADGRKVGVGLGLGLSIVHRLCGLMNHRLNVASRVAHGSAFSVMVKQVISTAPEDLDGKDLALSSVSSLAGHTILVLDNDAILRNSLRIQIQDWGGEVQVAASQAEALTVIERIGVPDLVLADYELDDGETGIRVIAAIEDRIGRPMPFLILTGETAFGPNPSFPGAYLGVLYKPVKPEKLRSVLYAALAPMQSA